MFLIASSIGCTFIIKYGFIFESIRVYLSSKNKYIKEFLSCCMCLGFWCGFIMSLLTYKLDIMNINLDIVFISIQYGFIVSIISTMLDNILDYVDDVVNKIKNG